MPVFPVSELDRVIKASDSSLMFLTMQQEKQKDPLSSPSSSPLSSSLSLFSPSPYILNCKRRVYGAWEPRDALNGAWETKDAAKTEEPPYTGTHTDGNTVEESPGDLSQGFAGNPSGSETGRSSSLNNQLTELRDALEKFLFENWSSRGSHEENSSHMPERIIDLPILRKRMSREKILTEILSSRSSNSGNMKVQSDGLLTKCSDGNEIMEVPKQQLESSPNGSYVDDFFSPTGSSGDEFFDASSDGYSSNEDGPSRRVCKYSPSMLVDLELAHQLQTEVKQRIKAEEALQVLQQCQQEIVKILLSPGCSVPPRSNSPQPVASSAFDHGLASIIDEDWQDEDSQRTIVARLISSAVVRGAIRAEEAEALQKLLAIKDREASRLRHKLKFYEHVNYELSNKNQEATERARRIRRNRQKWFSISAKCLIAGVALGASGALVYWYLPWEKVRSIRSQLPNSSKLELET